MHIFCISSFVCLFLSKQLLITTSHKNCPLKAKSMLFAFEIRNLKQDKFMYLLICSTAVLVF